MSLEVKPIYFNYDQWLLILGALETYIEDSEDIDNSELEAIIKKIDKYCVRAIVKQQESKRGVT